MKIASGKVTVVRTAELFTERGDFVVFENGQIEYWDSSICEWKADWWVEEWLDAAEYEQVKVAGFALLGVK